MTKLTPLLVARQECLNAGGTGTAAFFEHLIRQETREKSQEFLSERAAFALDLVYGDKNLSESSAGQGALFRENRSVSDANLLSESQSMDQSKDSSSARDLNERVALVDRGSIPPAGSLSSQK